MALISGGTIITSISLFHITLAYFFLTSPITITDQALVFIIGEAMGIVRRTRRRVLSRMLLTIHILALFALLRTPVPAARLPLRRATRRRHQRPRIALAARRSLAIPLGVTRSVYHVLSFPFVTTQADQGRKKKQTAPVRLLLFFCITFYSYVFGDSSPLYASTAYHASTWGEGLKNRVLFTWAFLEMITWFWVFATLREERRERAMKLAGKRAAEENML